MGYEQLGGSFRCHAGAGTRPASRVSSSFDEMARTGRSLRSSPSRDSARRSRGRRKRDKQPHASGPITVLGHVEQDAIFIEVMSAGSPRARAGNLAFDEAVAKGSSS